MTPEITIIRKVKLSGDIRRWPAYVLDQDEHGLWLFSPKGTIFRGQSGSEIGECEVGQGDRPEGQDVLHLIPAEAWWMAEWHVEYVHIDVGTPPALTDGEWRYVDLELDVLAYPDGRIEIYDEDEFQDGVQAGGISSREAAEAQDASEAVVQCLRSGIEPFGRVGWKRLEEAVGLSLPPITALRHVNPELPRSRGSMRR